jgi:hypothetical protein
MNPSDLEFLTFLDGFLPLFDVIFEALLLFVASAVIVNGDDTRLWKTRQGFSEGSGQSKC